MCNPIIILMVQHNFIKNLNDLIISPNQLNIIISLQITSNDPQFVQTAFSILRLKRISQCPIWKYLCLLESNNLIYNLIQFAPWTKRHANHILLNIYIQSFTMYKLDSQLEEHVDTTFLLWHHLGYKRLSFLLFEPVL